MPVKAKKLAVVSPQCVACGCCVKVCPVGAIVIRGGVRAVVDADRCIGCGRCARECPASVIAITEREVSL